MIEEAMLRQMEEDPSLGSDEESEKRDG